jgi:hypothetical protein
VHWEVKTFNGRPVIETRLLDLSALGARIEAPHPLAPRMHLEFTYLRPGEEMERSLAGMIVWCRALVKAAGRYHIGVKFYEANWPLDQELRNFTTVKAQP